MKNIETKKVASAQEAIDIINSLNYTNATFTYNQTTRDDNANINYRHFNGNGMGLIEIVVNGKLEIVRFFNFFRNIIVDIKLGDFTPDYSRFDEVINADDVQDSTNVVTETAEDTKEEPKMKITTKIAKNGATIYYVNGERVSRDIALDAANENRKGNLFTFETGYWNENTKTVNYKTLMIIAECTIKIQQKAFLHDLGFRIIVSGVEVKTFYASKDIAYDIKQARQNAAVLANKIAHAYICGAFGIRIMGGCDIKILNAPITEPDIDDYAVTVEAQDAAIDAEIENAKSNLRKIVDVQDTPTDNFTAQLAELQAKVDAARAVYDAKTNERMRLQAAVEDAEIEESISYENLRVATSELDRFGDANAKELRNNLITSDIRATRELIIYSQAGSVYCPALKYLDILFINGKFEIRCDKEASCIVYKFATYYTPEQVTAAISQLKDAIAHGKQTFQFPSVEELNQPLSLPTNIKDSLQRAMQTALDKYKDFCRTGQLVRAEHELKLYNICRRAKIQLACGNDEPPPEVKLPAPFKPTDADSAPSKILPTEFCLKYLNDAAPDGWTVTADGKAFLVKFKGNVIATLDSLATAKALPPDKFFAQFTPLVDKNFEPKEIFLKDLYRERSELLAMRDELPDDSDRLPTIDAMIKQLDRDIAKAEFAEYERTGIPIWF